MQGFGKSYVRKQQQSYGLVFTDEKKGWSADRVLTQKGEEEYIWIMEKPKKKKKKAKEARTRLIPPGEDMTGEDDEDEGGMYLEKEDMLVIYKALKSYKPTTGAEDLLRDIWLEQFDMMLVVDYGKPLDGD